MCYAHCNCIAGLEEECSHIAVVLYVVCVYVVLLAEFQTSGAFFCYNIW